MADNLARPYIRRQVVTADDLPDDVLLAIFDLSVTSYQDIDPFEAFFGVLPPKGKIESWQSLVHVCRRWRGLVFASPRRLNLELCYTTRTPARRTLDVWPALALLIIADVSKTSIDNVLAVIEFSNRICKIDLELDLDSDMNSRVEELWTAMQMPFPELTSLYLTAQSWSNVPVLPDLFLGGSVPRLQDFYLRSIPFPGLPRLLPSATHLVSLNLYDIPHSGYISPESMATCLSLLTNLKRFKLEFRSPQSGPDQENRCPPPQTRSVLLALTDFEFKGVNEYLEDLVSSFDTPQLHLLSATFFNDIDFNTSELKQFISRTPTLVAYNEARLIFRNHQARVSLRHPFKPSDRRLNVKVEILCQVLDWQLSNLAQICTMSLHPFLTMENLYIYEDPNYPPNWKDDTENAELNLLRPFVAVKNLYLSKLFSPRVALALQELTGERITEVLPALQNVLLEGFQPSEPVQDGIAQFISARQRTNRPVAISVWSRDRK